MDHEMQLVVILCCSWCLCCFEFLPIEICGGSFFSRLEFKSDLLKFLATKKLFLSISTYHLRTHHISHLLFFTSLYLLRDFTLSLSSIPPLSSLKQSNLANHTSLFLTQQTIPLSSQPSKPTSTPASTTSKGKNNQPPQLNNRLEHTKHHPRPLFTCSPTTASKPKNPIGLDHPPNHRELDWATATETPS